MTLMSPVTLGDVRRMVSGQGSNELDRLPPLATATAPAWQRYAGRTGRRANRLSRVRPMPYAAG